MSIHLPGIPNGTMLFVVECYYYGRSPKNAIGVRPITLDTFNVWARTVPEAEAAAAEHLSKHDLELIHIVSVDPVRRVVRERILNDPEFNIDFELIVHPKPPSAVSDYQPKD